MYVEIIFFKPTLVKTDSQVSFIFPLDILTWYQSIFEHYKQD